MSELQCKGKSIKIIDPMPFFQVIRLKAESKYSRTQKLKQIFEGCIFLAANAEAQGSKF